MGGQTSYVLTLDVGVPGQLEDLNLDSKIVSYPAGESIQFGILTEVDSAGLLHPVQGVSNVITGGVGATSRLAGVSVFDVAREQQLAATGGSSGSGYYQSGEMVPVLRKGRIFGRCDSTVAQNVYGAIGVWHPSAADSNGIRGVFSMATSSVTVNSELQTCPATIVTVRDVSTGAPQRAAGPPVTAPGVWTCICLLEVNLPGSLAPS